MSLEISLEQLAQYRGEGSSDVYVAIKGIVYNVTSASEFYGPGRYLHALPLIHYPTPSFSGGSYHVFAGRECARALALMKLESEFCNDDLEGLEEKNLKILDDWIKRFSDKYTIVGKVRAFTDQTICSNCCRR